MNVDGTNKVDITPTGANLGEETPSFSPDGKKIVFGSSRNDADGDIFVMGADGSNPTNLTPGNSQLDSASEWSPDGARIYFYRDVDPTGGINYHLAVMNADGSGQLDLGAGTSPSPSPDGMRIAFERDVGAYSHVWVANADGSAAKDLMPSTNLNSFDPEFSPDGTKILFVRDIDPAPLGFLYEVQVMNADGSGVTRVTTSPANSDSYDPGWESVYTCGGRRATIIGTQASERILGTKRADVIVGLGGKDKIFGGKGNDRLCGGDGKDKLIGGPGKDKVKQ
jgi:Tol biopolymer transport system component